MDVPSVTLELPFCYFVTESENRHWKTPPDQHLNYVIEISLCNSNLSTHGGQKCQLYMTITKVFNVLKSLTMIIACTNTVRIKKGNPFLKAHCSKVN